MQAQQCRNGDDKTSEVQDQIVCEGSTRIVSVTSSVTSPIVSLGVGSTNEKYTPRQRKKRSQKRRNLQAQRKKQKQEIENQT